ncbi:MAG: hypothetical protein ACOYLB_12580 [Phototrophicaceae bacterium]
MPPSKLIDTNVPLVAMDQERPPDCQRACLALIKRVLAGEVRVVLDTGKHVLQEYRKNMYPDPSNGFASQFLAYLLNNEYTLERVYRVKLTQDADGRYLTFPDDPRLARFDPSDKKWVALAIGYHHEMGESAPIVNASDSDWLEYNSLLREHGIIIEFLCELADHPPSSPT